MPTLQSPARRAWLALGAGLCLPRGALAAALPPFEAVEISVPEAPPRLGRALVILPRERKAGVALPVLILLHGLGETSGPRLGLRAWLEPYGLGRAWELLTTGSARREKYDYVSEEELAALSEPLKADPFAGLCVVCPFLPNPYAKGAAAPALDRYAAWLADGLLPAVREQVAEARGSLASTGIAGVSLGGFSALEVCLRHPELYKTVGTVQGAFGIAGARAYAERLSAAKQRRSVWVSTSTLDPYRKANEALAKELQDRAVPVTFSLRRGPHNQPFLREIGSIEMLLWHDRALRAD